MLYCVASYLVVSIQKKNCDVTWSCITHRHSYPPTSGTPQYLATSACTTWIGIEVTTSSRKTAQLHNYVNDDVIDICS